MTDFDDMIDELKQKRDELRVQMHLASKEVKDEWNELEEKMEDFSGKAKQFSSDAGGACHIGWSVDPVAAGRRTVQDYLLPLAGPARHGCSDC